MERGQPAVGDGDEAVRPSPRQVGGPERADLVAAAPHRRPLQLAAPGEAKPGRVHLQRRRRRDHPQPAAAPAGLGHRVQERVDRPARRKRLIGVVYIPI